MKKQDYVLLALVFTSTLFSHLILNTNPNSIFGSICYAQEIDPAKEQIFKEADEALQRAESGDITLLAPSTFIKANGYYQKALREYEAGESLEEVRENLQRTIEHIQVAFEKAELSKSVLRTLIQTRKEAKALEIPKRAGYIFSKAESMFGEAAMEVENGDLASARSIAKEAEREYRVTVIEALRTFVLADAKQKVKNIEATIPEESSRKATAELDKTESFIMAQETTDLAIEELIAQAHNQIQQALTFMNPEPYDLVVEELVLSTEELNVGEDAVIRSVVRNTGNQPAKGITILFMTKDDREIGRATIEHLEPAQTEEVSVTATIPRLDEYQVTVRVDPENLFAESNEQNNEIQQVFTIESLGTPIWRYIISSIAAAIFSGSGATFFTRRRQKKKVPVRDGEAFKVTGRVMKPENTPVSGAVVIVFDKRLRIEVLLGKTTTDEEGCYEVEYTVEELVEARKNQPDLVIRAFDKEDREIASSRVIYNAQQAETVDLILGEHGRRETSEYHQLMETLTPLLQNVVLTELTGEDVAFLASKIGISPQQIDYLAHSVRLGEKTKCPPEVLYGLFRQNLPTSLPELLAQSPGTQRSALETAVNNNTISATVHDFLESALERFQKLAVDHVLEPLEPLPPGTTSLGDLLSTVQGITPERQKEFLKLYLQHQGSIEDFWEKLRENAEFREAVDDLQLTLQLGVLSQNHLPMVKKLKELNRDGTIPSLRDLARLDVDSWSELINTPVPDDNNMLMFSVNWTSELQDSLDNGDIPDELRQSFADSYSSFFLAVGDPTNELLLSAGASISLEEAGNRWLIIDNERTYTVSKEEDKLSIYSSIIGAPPDVPGENGVEKIRNYAKTMSVMLSAILTKKVDIDWLLRFGSTVGDGFTPSR